MSPNCPILLYNDLSIAVGSVFVTHIREEIFRQDGGASLRATCIECFNNTIWMKMVTTVLHGLGSMQ